MIDLDDLDLDPAAELAAAHDAGVHARRRNGKPRAQTGPRVIHKGGDHCAVSGTRLARDIAREMAEAEARSLGTERRAWQVVEDALILYGRALHPERSWA